MRCYLVLGMLLASVSASWAQRDDYRLVVQPLTQAIKVDGKLDEAAWQHPEPATRFFQNFPFDTSVAQIRTEVWAASDGEFLYFAARCYTTGSEPIIASLRRDFEPGRSDVFSVYLDPFNDQTNGFHFGLTPLGVQREGLMSNGNNVDMSWDNAWFSGVVNEGNAYTLEMAIPFSTLRYSEGNTLWRVNFGRNDLTVNEISSWVPVPRNFGLFNLLFTGRLEWTQPPPKPRKVVAVIPYALTRGAVNNYRTGDMPPVSYNFGGDIKLPVSASLNLDLTFNPDFAQADVDVQQINLSRFSLFFPERRQFFIENSDLFARFGFSQARPFFSRRIGLQTPIVGGARLSGKIGRDWRVGLMTVQTEGSSEQTLTANNYTVAAVQRQVFGTSNVGVIAVNRQGMNGNRFDADDYNRVIGVDFNLQSPNNKWRGKVFQQQSLSPTQGGRAFANGMWLMYNVPKFAIEWNHEWVGRDFNAETGFVPRVDNFDPLSRQSFRYGYFRIDPEARYVLFPKDSPINRISLELSSTSIFLDTLSHQLNEGETWARSVFIFGNSAEAGIGLGTLHSKLVLPLDIGADGPEPLLRLGQYNWQRYGFWFYSNNRKEFFYGIDAFTGGFYNGTRHFINAEVNYRWQPWGTFSASWQHNDIQLPEPQGRAVLNLIGVRAELSFSKSIFWTTFVQFNSQAENLNHFSRLQWRFAPMSDLFVVYSENYDPQNIAIKNRQLVIKLVYWLNARL